MPTSDAAVRKATGWDWQQWLAHLDAEAAEELSHPQIVSVIRATDRASAWWSQNIAVGYERARGLRDKHQTRDGYSINKSRTIDAPTERLFRLWMNETERASWLSERLRIRGFTRDKSIRADLVEGGSRLRVDFQPDGRGRSRVVVEHSHVTDADLAEHYKRFWKQALEELKSLAETSGPATPDSAP